MIFQHTIDKVLSGEKTQTRRRIKESKQFEYVVGRTYAALPDRGTKAVARIRIVRVRVEDVRDISDDDVRAEGFRSYQEFIQTWFAMHDLEMRYMDEWDTIPREVIQAVLRLRPAELYLARVYEFNLVQEEKKPLVIKSAVLQKIIPAHTNCPNCGSKSIRIVGGFAEALKMVCDRCNSRFTSTHNPK